MALHDLSTSGLDRISDAADRIGVEEIRDAFQKLQNEPKTPSVFGGKTQEEYYRILSDPEQLIEKIKTGKLTGNEIKSYTKLLQVYHKEEYDEIRKIDHNLTKRAFDAINSSEDAKKGMKKHIVKSMHIAETLGLNEKIKEGGVDGFITTYGIKPDGAVLNEETLKTLEYAWLRPTYDGYMYFQDVGGTIINRYLDSGNNPNIVIDQLTEEFEKSFNVNNE